MSDQGPPAGWYPHPSMSDTQRYWNGSDWTGDLAPAYAPQRVTVVRKDDETRLVDQLKAPVALLVIATIVGLLGIGTPEEIQSSLFGGAGLLGLIGLVLVARELLRSSR
jgi:hypothetical protein